MAVTFSVVCVTYNRPKYLRELIASLNDQETNIPFEVIILDNGSPPANQPRVVEAVDFCKAPTKFIRQERNLVGPQPWEQALGLAEGAFVLLPGDDDLPHPNYIETFGAMRKEAPQATILAAGTRHVDEFGSPVGRSFRPGSDVRREIILADLLHHSTFGMVCTAISRSALDFAQAPLSRTTVDWWMWFQGLYAGDVVSTPKEVIDYRQHPGQEATLYRRREVEIEALRLLVSEVQSENFLYTLRQFSPTQISQFVNRILSYEDLANGEHEKSGIIELLLAQSLVRLGELRGARALYARGYARDGILVSPTYMKSLTSDPEPAPVAAEMWSQIPVRLRSQGECEHLKLWREVLSYSQGESSAGIELQVKCERCSSDGRGVTFCIRVSGKSSEQCLLLNEDPELSEVVQLVDAITNAALVEDFRSLTRAERWIVGKFRGLKRWKKGKI